MKNPATEAQLTELRRQAKLTIGWDFENDLPKMAHKMGFEIAALSDLTTRQASTMIDRLKEINDSRPMPGRGRK